MNGSIAPSDRRVLACVDAAADIAEGIAFFQGLPEEWRNRSDVHFLLLAPESSPPAIEECRETLRQWGIGNTLILPLTDGLDYGARCKIALRAGVDRGYDAIAILPAQAPSLALLDLIHSWDETEADVLLRQPETAARSDLATAVLNAATGLRLATYTAPCRVYAAEFLQQIPFELNGDDGRFAVEILLQAAYVGARIVACAATQAAEQRAPRVEAKMSCWRALAAAMQYRMHHWGMLCSLKLRQASVDRYRDKTAAPYTTHTLAVREVRRRGARRVLDIGCGRGFVAAACMRQGAEVTGIDACDPPAVPLAAFHRLDLERDALPCAPADFDATLLLDVIEHLSYPEQFLLSLRNAAGTRSETRGTESTARPLLILSTPNVAFITVRLGLLLGRFNYADRGILDVTHKRLFTRSSLLRMLRDCGCEVESCRAVGAPFPAVMPNRWGQVLGVVADGLARLWPSLFAFQFFVVCRLKPGIQQVLERAASVTPAAVRTSPRSTEEADL
uniref:Methyltransferase domain-containing protein n=1 Tax=Schlesneria paludicola TaxID=360056 RepID=A0A7C4LJS4_9PLAN